MKRDERCGCCPDYSYTLIFISELCDLRPEPHTLDTEYHQPLCRAVLIRKVAIKGEHSLNSCERSASEFL